MPILGRLYTLLTICSVFGFQKTFLLSVLVAFILMDFPTSLEHLSQNYDGFFVFDSFKEVSEILCLLLLLALGFKSLYLRGKSNKLKNGFCSENLLDEKFDLWLLKKVPLNDTAEEFTEKPKSCPCSDRKINSDFDENYDVDSDSDSDSEEDDELQTEEESDVLALREVIKIERRRANAAIAELVKERAASATAAEEAMAMILRLQSEKSSIEMESNQYRRMAEEKRIHDQQVIESLQWLVWNNESEISLLQEDLIGVLKSDEGVDDIL